MVLHTYISMVVCLCHAAVSVSGMTALYGLHCEWSQPKRRPAERVQLPCMLLQHAAHVYVSDPCYMQLFLQYVLKNNAVENQISSLLIDFFKYVFFKFWCTIFTFGLVFSSTSNERTDGVVDWRRPAACSCARKIRT